MNKDKLSGKLDNRIGKNAITKDNNKMGVITGFVLKPEGTPALPLTVYYLISYGEGKNATVRLVHENMVVMMLEPNK